ncbi:MAG: hypothetical protein LUQ31_10715, partial [Methanoregula sp.]|nr:hypothetical protein [Methanoregula sp.]
RSAMAAISSGERGQTKKEKSESRVGSHRFIFLLFFSYSSFPNTRYASSGFSQYSRQSRDMPRSILLLGG